MAKENQGQQFVYVRTNEYGGHAFKDVKVVKEWAKTLGYVINLNGVDYEPDDLDISDFTLPPHVTLNKKK